MLPKPSIAVIPLMVSSLKKKHTSREALLIASKSFLRVFTDATNCVPRHRHMQSVFAFSHVTSHVDLSGGQEHQHRNQFPLGHAIGWLIALLASHQLDLGNPESG